MNIVERVAARVAANRVAAGDPSQETISLSRSSLEYFTQGIRLEGWTGDMLPVVQKASREASDARYALVEALRRIYENVTGPKKEIPPQTADALEKLHAEYTAKCEGLHDALSEWLMSVERGQSTLDQKGRDLKTLRGNIAQYNEWARFKVTSKGRTGLGTKLKFDANEISVRNSTYVTYNTAANGRKYRVAPNNGDDRNEWRVDVGGGVGWEALMPDVYKSPKDAAKALAEKLGVV